MQIKIIANPARVRKDDVALALRALADQIDNVVSANQIDRELRDAYGKVLATVEMIEPNDLKDTLDQIKQDHELHAARWQILQIRKMLADAMCFHCGEQLGEDDTDITTDDEDRTVHAHCLQETEKDNQ